MNQTHTTMPLLMITGYPSSGKTTIAKQLVEAFEAKIAEAPKYANLKVELVNDERLGIAKETYREARSEKSTRGLQMSSVKKLINKETIVILDNLTYIKGFRYQLFCEAKAQLTNSCVLQVGLPADKCKEINATRGDDAWPEDLFDALVFRYEEPNGMTRWDSPLYFVIPGVDQLPVDQLWESLVLNKPKPPNQATVLKAATPSNYLFELDKITQEIVSACLELQKVNPGGTVKIKDYPTSVTLPHKSLSLAQLQRIRRNYIALNRVQTVEAARIPLLFIDFLNKNFERED